VAARRGNPSRPYRQGGLSSGIDDPGIGSCTEITGVERLRASADTVGVRREDMDAIAAGVGTAVEESSTSTEEVDVGSGGPDTNAGAITVGVAFGADAGGVNVVRAAGRGSGSARPADELGDPPGAVPMVIATE